MQKDIDIRDKIIIDLSSFINILRQKHEIFPGIDASGATDKAKNSVDGLLERTKLIDVISLKYGIHKEPNNYMRDQKRTDFLFCSEHIYTFLPSMKSLLPIIDEFSLT